MQKSGKTMQKHTFNNNYAYIPLDDEFQFSHFYHTNGYYERENMHVHNCIELGICLGGSGLMFIGGGVWRFTEGSVSVINAGSFHIGQSPNKNPSKWRFLNVGVAEYTKSVCNGIFDDRESREILKLIFSEFDEKAPDYKENVRNLLSVFFSRNLRKGVGSHHEYGLGFDKILPALSLIANCEQEISVKELAAACYLNENYFRALFKKQVGCTPVEYVNGIKLERACLMLETTNLSITEISGRAGFSTISTFNRLFKSVFHKSPSEYRKEK